MSDLSSALAAAVPGRFERLPAELSGALLRLRTAGANAAGAIQPDAEDPARLRSRRLAESAVDTAARILAMSPADVVWVEVDERGTHVLKVAPLDVAGRLASAAFRPLPGGRDVGDARDRRNVRPHRRPVRPVEAGARPGRIAGPPGPAAVRTERRPQAAEPAEDNRDAR